MVSQEFFEVGSEPQELKLKRWLQVLNLQGFINEDEAYMAAALEEMVSPEILDSQELFMAAFARAFKKCEEEFYEGYRNMNVTPPGFHGVHLTMYGSNVTFTFQTVVGESKIRLEYSQGGLKLIECLDEN